MRIIPFCWLKDCWCNLALYWLPEKDLPTEMLDITGWDRDVWLNWLLLLKAGDSPNDSVDAQIPFPKKVDEELFRTDEWATDSLDDWHLTPTTPTSRLIAPTAPDDLESGEGTWTGSVDEEYNPPTELFDDVAVSGRELCSFCPWTCNIEVGAFELVFSNLRRAFGSAFLPWPGP